MISLHNIKIRLFHHDSKNTKHKKHKKQKKQKKQKKYKKYKKIKRKTENIKNNDIIFDNLGGIFCRKI